MRNFKRNFNGLEIEKANQQIEYNDKQKKYNDKYNRLNAEPATSGQITYIQQQIGIDASGFSKLEAGNVINRIKKGCYNQVKFGMI